MQTVVVIHFQGMNASSLVLQTHQSVHIGETKGLHLFNQQNHIFALVLLLLPEVTFDTAWQWDWYANTWSSWLQWH